MLDRRFWEPDIYSTWHDAVMERLPTGTVEVLPIRPDEPPEDP